MQVDGIYYCPHSPKDDCACRKPRTGLIERAKLELKIDLGQSWMIGDKASDIETGFNAGMGTGLVFTGYGKTEAEKLRREPDLTGKNLFEIAEKINMMD